MQHIHHLHARRLLLAGLALSSACGQVLPGTQVGIEHSEDGGCTLVSTEQITDITASVDGFVNTPAEMLDAIPGTFHGGLMGEEEVPMDGDITLTVDVADTEISVRHYEPTSSDESSEGSLTAAFCPPQLQLLLDVDLRADGFPTYTGQLDATIRPEDEGEDTWAVYAGADPTDGLDGDLPPPSRLDAAAVDLLLPTLSIGGGSTHWSVDLSWTSETHDGLGEDGGSSVDGEVIYMGLLTRITEDDGQ